MNYNLFAEFRDPHLEHEYYLNVVSSEKGYFRNVIFTLGLLYFLFLIPDFFNLHTAGKLLLVLIPKLIFLLVVVIHFFRMQHVRPHPSIQYVLLIYEVLFVACYTATILVYENPNYLIKCFDIILIVISMYLVPTKWKWNLLASIFMLLTFYTLTASVFAGVKPSTVWAGRVYVTIVLIICSVTSYRINRIQRQNYFNAKTLEEMAQKDPMTGIYNRARFEKESRLCDRMYRQFHVEYSIIMFDFDNFKHINDTFGHHAGDEIILETVALVKGSIRENDVFVRWGGDEFILLLPDSDKEHASALANRLRQLIHEHEFAGGRHISGSFSVVSAPDAPSLQKLVETADELLYRAKDDGRNTVCAGSPIG